MPGSLDCRTVCRSQLVWSVSTPSRRSVCSAFPERPTLMSCSLRSSTPSGGARSLLIDPPGTEVTDACAYVEALAQSGSANAAVYFPPFEGGDPPSGAVAGMYARIDRERGVWKAPAGEEAVLRGEVTLARRPDRRRKLEAELSSRERDPAISGQWCPAVGREDDPGCGSGDSEWKYVPVRRLGLYVEHSIDRGTQWAVSSPTTSPRGRSCDSRSPSS